MAQKTRLKLHIIGYWALWRYEALLSQPHDFVDPDWPEDERDRIANYLSRGYKIEFHEGYAVNRFRIGEDDDMHPEMGDAELTEDPHPCRVEAVPLEISRQGANGNEDGRAVLGAPGIEVGDVPLRLGHRDGACHAG